MMVEIKPLNEITKDALTILYQEIGIVNTVRFINQFTQGFGNYTEERQLLFADLTLDDALEAIKRRRS